VRVLALDTSTRVGSVSVVDGDRVLAARTNDDPLRHAEAIVPLVDAALADAGIARADVELVACGLGPGSFTGVRVALATAKGIALGLGAPLVGVGSLEVMAAALPAGEPAAVALIDARKGEVFWAPCSRDGARLAEPVCTPAADLAAALAPWLARGLPLVGELAAAVAPSGARALAGVADFPTAAALARVAAARFAASGPDDLDDLEPLYVRPPDVTLPHAPPPGRTG
jgi:tRNA threonylcarbamoyladenosine biosynthesis protein TsaB